MKLGSGVWRGVLPKILLAAFLFLVPRVKINHTADCWSMSLSGWGCLCLGNMLIDPVNNQIVFVIHLLHNQLFPSLTLALFLPFPLVCIYFCIHFFLPFLFCTLSRMSGVHSQYRCGISTCVVCVMTCGPPAPLTWLRASSALCFRTPCWPSCSATCVCSPASGVSSSTGEVVRTWFLAVCSLAR